MADSSLQYSGSNPLTMENIERLVGNALNNSNAYSSYLPDSSTESKSFKPSVSLSHSLVMPTSAGCNSNAGNFQHSSITKSNESNSPSRPFLSGTCCNEPNTSTNNYDTKSYFSDRYGVDDIKKENPESSDGWVDYQFNRLVIDRKGQWKPNSGTGSTISSRYDNQNNQSSSKHKSVEEIIREYSVNPPYSAVTSIIPNSCRLSHSMGERQYRSEWMNKSHNNEYLDTSNSEVEQVRRIGSSVDGKVCDISDTLNSKCSLTGGRCRTPVSSGVQIHTSVSEDYKDYKRLPDRVSSESEVDRDPSSQTSGKDYNEIKSEMADLSYSFQKERDRLRHLETLIKKTPISGTTHSSSAAFFQPKLSNRYSSRFLTDLTERKTYSSTDYANRFVTSDWRTSSPHRDYIGRTASSPSYKNFTTTTTPRSNYWSDYNAMQQLNAGYETNRGVSTNSHVYETEMGKHGKYHFNDVSESRYNSKSKLNRSMNAKKDKTSSKSNGSQKQRQKTSVRQNNTIKEVSHHQNERGFDQSDNRKQFKYDNLYDGHYERVGNRPTSPSSSSSSSKDSVPKRKAGNKQKGNSRYKSYQPLSFRRDFPQRTKSEATSLTTSFSTLPGQNIVPEIDKYKWQSLLASSNNMNPTAPTRNYDKRIGRPKEPSYKNSEETPQLRSRSGGADNSVTQAWMDEKTTLIEVPKEIKRVASRGSSRGKKIIRKPKLAKPKKMSRSVSRHKKKTF